jgi:hypothetical protein
MTKPRRTKFARRMPDGIRLGALPPDPRDIYEAEKG